MRRLAENGILLLGASLMLAAVSALHQQRPSAEYALRDAWFQPIGAGAAPPAEAADDWRRVTLPDDWKPDRRFLSRGAYRIPFDLEAPPAQALAVYVPSSSMNAALWLNGVRIGDGGSMQPPIARSWTRPLFFPVPDVLLRAGRNELRIEVAAIPIGPGLLGEVYVGPSAPLRASFERRFALNVTLVQALTGGLFAVAFFVGILARNARDPVYRWYAVGAFLWGIHNLNLFVKTPPVPDRAWDWLWRVTLVGLAAVVVPFVNHFQRRPQPRLEGAVLATATLGALALALLPADAFYRWGRTALDVLALSLGGISIARVITAPRLGSEARWLWLTGATFMVFATHDFLVVAGRWPRVEGYYLQYAAIPIFLVFTTILILRFTRALGRSERLGRELETRAAERERMTREMHDGLGAELVSTLAMVEEGEVDRGAVAQSLRASLQELRLMIHALESFDGDLPSALGLLRERIESRVGPTGLEVRWEVGDLPRLPELGSSHALNALRIVQEAVTNVIKHAEASTLRVSTGEERDEQGRPGVFIAVEDDGRGGCGPERPGGYGLRNMRTRAAELGGRLVVEPADPGTRVRLWIPRDPAQRGRDGGLPRVR